jgi:cytochrome oxidase Cu insertion factor (SCO1/SenC/PrrC family)
MKYLLLLLTVIFSFNEKLKAFEHTIIIEIKTKQKIDEKQLGMMVREIDEPDYIYDSLANKRFVFTQSDKSLKCIYRTSHTMIFNGSTMPSIFGREAECILEPGDSIQITVGDDSVSFSGKGCEKFELLYRLNTEVFPHEKKLLGGKTYVTTVDSVSAFVDYKNKLEEIYLQKLTVIDRFKSRISNDCFTYMRYFCLNYFRTFLTYKFMAAVYYNRDKLKLSDESVIQIYDSLVAPFKPGGPNEPTISYWTPCTLALLHYAKLESFRQHGFGIQAEMAVRYEERCEKAKEMYTGLGRAKALTAVLMGSVLYKLSSLEEEGITIVNKYLPLLADQPAYQQYVQAYYKKRIALKKTIYAPDFALKNVHDKSVKLNDFKGKIVLMDFWFTGCTGCIQMNQALKNVEKAFENYQQVEFVSICTDKDKAQWTRSIANKKYTTGTGTNLYTGGQGNKHPIMDDYAIISFPALFLLDAEGKFIKDFEDPRHDNGKVLIKYIKNMLPASPADGPYVLYKGEQVITKSVEVNDAQKPMVKEAAVNGKEMGLLSVRTDIPGKTFAVKLKDSLTIEPSVFQLPSKVLALSDIEGEFQAFRELLQANGVIDDNFNWIFGNGHLVLAGDFFDRGSQVTETLWLIYSLEEQAKAKGGYVHFILGNHEIMNLSGDIRYVIPKYRNNARLLKEDYTPGLYGKNSELGRWLRTKNIMEKIGDVLYTHGGISAEMNQQQVTVSQINSVARSYYDLSGTEIKEEPLSTIMSSAKGPFWYRGYYKEEGNAQPSQIDSTLRQFNVKLIVTGHTIIGNGDKITVHFDGKVVNTDTRHAEGRSEALLFENGAYYRLNTTGEKKLLKEIHK